MLTQTRHDTAKMRKALIRKAKAGGLYENFGQREARKLRDKYHAHAYSRDGVWDAILEFEEWARNYTS